LLNIIWPIFIIISIIYAFFVGRVEEVNTSIFESAESTVNLMLTFFGTLCLWNGIMEIASNTDLKHFSIVKNF